MWLGSLQYVNIWNNLIFGNLPLVEGLLAHVNRVFHSKRFWKKFDAVTFSLKDSIHSSFNRVTRHSSRIVLRYLTEKSSLTKNQTSYNRIGDIWQEIYSDFDKISLSNHLEDIFQPILDGSNYRTQTTSFIG